MELFPLRDESGKTWAEIRRDHAGKLTLVPNGDLSGLPQNHRLYLFDANGQGLNLNPTGDKKRFYINCARGDGYIILNLVRDSGTDDIVGLDVAMPVKLRYFGAAIDYFRLIHE